MSEQTTTAQEPPHVEIDSRPSQTKQEKTSVQEIIDALKSAEDDIGQISELRSEEDNLVKEFLQSLAQLMQPFTSTMAVSSTAVSEELSNVTSANLNLTGYLAIQYVDGRFALEYLGEEKNRDLLVAVLQDVMPKFKELTSAKKHGIENRMKFLSSITKETQKMSKALSATATQAQGQ